MVRHIACLRGWHPALARAEIAALLPEMTTTRLEGRRLLALEGSCDEIALAEAVAVSSGCQAILCEAIVWPCEGEAPIDRLMPAILDHLNHHPRDGTVAVRAWRHEGRIEGVGPSRLAQRIGGRLHDLGYAIDLEHPQHRFGVVIDASSNTIACGWMLGFGDESDGVSSRKAAERPFFKPVSLDPRLARLAVNLASGPVGNRATIDVMTGTGGFLIEAALSNRIAVGLDLDPVMVEGAIRNLEWALNAEGRTEHRAMVLAGDATKLTDALTGLDAPVSGFVLDPPYGRNSQGSLEPMALLKNVLDSVHEVALDGAGLVLILPIHPMGEHPDEPIPRGADVNLLHGDWQGIEHALHNAHWSIQNRWVEHVHASLSRLILHATAAPQD
jgi:tRNA (guanine10-N2)-dimethyltransferase